MRSRNQSGWTDRQLEQSALKLALYWSLEIPKKSQTGSRNRNNRWANYTITQLRKICWNLPYLEHLIQLKKLGVYHEIDASKVHETARLVVAYQLAGSELGGAN